MAEPAEQDPVAERPVGPWPILGAAALLTLFGLVNSLHVLGLLTGRLAFMVTTEVSRGQPGFDTDQSPVPTALAPEWERISHLASIGGTTWLLSLTAVTLVAALVGWSLALHPEWPRKLRSGELPAPRFAVTACLTAGLLVAAMWPMPPEVYTTRFPGFRVAMAGALLWLLWHRLGWLHDRSRVPSRLTLAGQFACGALVGLAVHYAFRHQPRAAEVRIGEDWLGAGFYAAEPWRQVGLHLVASRSLAALGVAALMAFLAPVGVGLGRRLVWVSPLLLAGLALYGTGEVWRQHDWVNSHDWGMPFRSLLSRPTGPRREPEERVVMVLDRSDRALGLARATGRSIYGSRLNPANHEAVLAFLNRRGSQSCLARAAYVHLHDERTWDWDVDGALAVQMANLRSPAATPVFGTSHLESLLYCARSEAAERAVEQLLDPRVFTWRAPSSAARLARICWRWGRLEACRPIVKDLAPGVLKELAAKPPPRCDGVIRGRVLREGRPWKGAKVGVVPFEQRDQLQTAYVTPWPQRLICAAATADADGRFTLPHLFDGDYALVVAVPLQELIPLQGVLPSGRLGKLTLGGAVREHDLGTIDLRAWKPLPPPVQARLPKTPLGGASLAGVYWG
ncbi:MAG: hypothetical protein HYU66_21315 [Armatimonadetes bacterium]|nr:hypothetical protein [Armatimonadota bacterium]